MDHLFSREVPPIVGDLRVVDVLGEMEYDYAKVMQHRRGKIHFLPIRCLAEDEYGKVVERLYCCCCRRFYSHDEFPGHFSIGPKGTRCDVMREKASLSFVRFGRVAVC